MAKRIVLIPCFLVLVALQADGSCSNDEKTAITGCLNTYLNADSHRKNELPLVKLGMKPKCSDVDTDCSAYTSLIECINGHAGQSLSASCLPSVKSELDSLLANEPQVGYGCTFEEYGNKCPNLQVSIVTSISVDGNWTAWSEWTTCNASCGGGNQTRNRSCSNPAPSGGGKNCTGESVGSQECNMQQCPINGNWSTWTQWGTCSNACGDGNQTRNRTCSNPAPQHGGLNCTGENVESQECNTHSCPIHGNWSSWTQWIACSISCGGGNQTRNRTCTNPVPEHGGLNCTGTNEEVQQCNTQSCPIHGNWTRWSQWGACNNSCGSGVQTRNRTCSNPVPQHGGINCTGLNEDNQVCNTQPCPIPGNWSSWNQWGACTVLCGGGSQTRNRTCSAPAPQHGGLNCTGTNAENRTCNAQLCPINGSWSAWNQWGVCSISCGGGNQTRIRTCSNPAPQYGGFNCRGDSAESQACNTLLCPIHGNWSFWSNWGACSNSCGGGSQSRNRTCGNPVPQHGGLNCTGETVDNQPCNTQPCPIHGDWTTWSSWDACSVLCGNGSRQRNRTCTNPSPQHGGMNCSGTDAEIQACNKQPCPINGNWTWWSPWGACSATCGGGNTTRNRTCSNPVPQHGGHNCTGTVVETQSCSLQPCSVNGSWSPWSEWAMCSISCGGGNRTRHRTCTNPAPQHGGLNCFGNGTETKTCVMNPCPINGHWATWSSWGSCSVSCGSGYRERNRTCSDPAPLHGGTNCNGNGTATQICDKASCPVNTTWSSWSNWSKCNVTCGEGSQSRSRNCSTGNCTGNDLESRQCNGEGCSNSTSGNVWGDWTLWSACSVTCGNGSQSRSRTCNSTSGIANCTGIDLENQECNLGSCVTSNLNGTWSHWQAWSNCNVSCGLGNQTRNRSCNGTGTPCQGNHVETRNCNASHCGNNTHLDNGWSLWTTWTNCSAACGVGNQTRTRNCSAISINVANCSGPVLETRACSNNCTSSSEYSWTSWTQWSLCDVTCGTGTRMRERQCSNSYRISDVACGGANVSSESCTTTPACPTATTQIDVSMTFNMPFYDVYHNLSDPVTRTLVDEAKRALLPLYNSSIPRLVDLFVKRIRSGSVIFDVEVIVANLLSESEIDEKINDVAKVISSKGSIVIGNTSVAVTDVKVIPVDGKWSDWSPWSQCDVTCGGGTQSRGRTCSNPPPRGGGSNCSALAFETKQCNTTICSGCAYMKFSCSDNVTCIENNLVCDGLRDCPDGSDESLVTCNDANCVSPGRKVFFFSFLLQTWWVTTYKS